MRILFKSQKRTMAWLLLVMVGIYFLSSCTRSAAPPTLTTAMSVDISQLASYQFNVPSNTDLTLSSTDRLAHTCTILGMNKQISIPQGQSSAAFQLAAGEYKLNCGIPNKDAKIVSK